MGIVEEKSSRVVEVLLSTIRPTHLLAGKIIGLGILGLGQLIVLAVAGLGIAAAAGALDVDGDVSSPRCSRSPGSSSATPSTPPRSRAPARSCRARRSCSRC